MSLIVSQIETRRGWVDQVAENAARQARVSAYYTTTGGGEALVAAALSFGIGFLDVPSFTSGYEVVSTFTAQHFPMATAFVHEWLFNVAETLCTGAKVGFVVDDAAWTGTSVVKHHLAFTGEAIKVMPPGAT